VGREEEGCGGKEREGKRSGLPPLHIISGYATGVRPAIDS